MRLLLVEDNDRLAGLIREGLDRQGFVVDWCETVEGAEAAQQVGSYDLVLLDLGLPDADGLEFVRAMRRRKDMTPLLILTARGGLDDRVLGLDAGADDYLVKPFQTPELAARCRALLRRPGTALGTTLSSGNVRFDPADRTLTIAKRAIEATPREIDLLEHLLRRAGRVVHKAALENSLYSMDAEVTPNALEACVSRLRKRIASAGADVQIKTIHGVGYGLFGPEEGNA